MKNTKPHPLESLARAAFAENGCQDGTTLAMYLSGNASFPVPRHNKAYHLVATDVLGYMTSQGKLFRNSAGWYQLELSKGKTYD